MSVSRRHLLARLGLALPAALVLAATSRAEAAAAHHAHHRHKHNAKEASRRQNRHVAQNHHRRSATG